MPSRSRRRPFRALIKDDAGGPTVENALILSLTAVMIYSLKATTGVAMLLKPAQQGFAALIRALS
jgi:Flp pilus assembly pilin Flp|uniref:Flp/Fap pilin component n=1 Tax=Caulobacter sp. (strain K31) TaxID=366602 RepID=B0SX23_CAUSK